MIEDYGFVPMGCVVSAEVADEGRDFAVIFDIERFYDIEAVAAGLAGDDPVDVGVVVHTDADWGVGVEVEVNAGVEGVGVGGISEGVEIVVVVGVVFVGFAHR